LNIDYLKSSLAVGRKRVISINNAMLKVRRGEMGEGLARERRLKRGPGESIISAISAGTVFILIGLVFVLALPNSLWDSTISFFTSLTIQQVPGIGISLPAPLPSGHALFYTALFQFSLGLAFLQILVLLLRFGFASRIQKIAETIGNLVFWFGASYFAYTYLNSSTTLKSWFSFWAGILIVIGLSIVAQAAVRLAKK